MAVAIVHHTYSRFFHELLTLVSPFLFDEGHDYLFSAASSLSQAGGNQPSETTGAGQSAGTSGNSQSAGAVGISQSAGAAMTIFTQETETWEEERRAAGLERSEKTSEDKSAPPTNAL